MGETQSFWPQLNADPPGETPEDLLRQQADLLADQTQGLLRGAVEIGSHGEWITLDLFVVAPRLNDYSYRLFKVRHKPTNPFDRIEIVVSSRDIRRVTGRDNYEREVENLIGSQETASVLGELLALSRRADANPPTGS